MAKNKHCIACYTFDLAMKQSRAYFHVTAYNVKHMCNNHQRQYRRDIESTVLIVRKRK